MLKEEHALFFRQHGHSDGLTSARRYGDALGHRTGLMMARRVWLLAVVGITKPSPQGWLFREAPRAAIVGVPSRPYAGRRGILGRTGVGAWTAASGGEIACRAHNSVGRALIDVNGNAVRGHCVGSGGRWRVSKIGRACPGIRGGIATKGILTRLRFRRSGPCLLRRMGRRSRWLAMGLQFIDVIYPGLRQLCRQSVSGPAEDEVLGGRVTNFFSSHQRCRG